MPDVSKFGDLSRAEQEFADACEAGETCTLGDGACPDADAGDDRVIRGALVRWFALGGGAKGLLHEKGVSLEGALISGHLDLSGSSSDCDLELKSCRFQRKPQLKGTKLRSLSFAGSALPGLDAGGLRVDGQVALSDGFQAVGPVTLIRAKIGSDLDCRAGRFEAAEQDALNADGAEIGGSVFLMGRRDEEAVTPFYCEGTARFVSASIGDSFMVLDAVFKSGDRKYALSLALAEIRRQLTLKNFVRFEGRLNLSGASTYSLNDSPADDHAPNDMILNGFEYVHFSAKAPTDVATRLDWLSRQNPEDYGQDFWLQPYSQLARVLRAVGHDRDARKIRIEKEKRQGKVSLRLAWRERRWFGFAVSWIGDRFMRHVIGYGYKPHLSLAWMAVILSATAWFFHETWEAGDMTPAVAPILVSQAWQDTAQSHPVHTAAAWGEGPGKDYETFQPFAYAFDLFVPLVDLGQRDTWGPSTERGPLGRVGWWLRWVIEIVGWVVTALAAAAVTGLVRRD
ncbi:MAG: hypothetical protein AB8B85_05190 [Paracoccaceae bacterium]